MEGVEVAIDSVAPLSRYRKIKENLFATELVLSLKEMCMPSSKDNVRGKAEGK